MKIGIFGGSFNPPHKAHKQIALDLIEKKYVDKIIYVPTGDNYKKPNLLNSKHRMNMLKIMVEECEKISVSDFEVQGSLYTINTLNHFKKEYPNDEIFFICGTDNLYELDTWHTYDEILKKYKLLVIAREKNNFDEIIKKYSEYRKSIILANIEMPKTSSTIVRKEIAENGFTEKLEDFLEKKVIAYLKDFNINYL